MFEDYQNSGLLIVLYIISIKMRNYQTDNHLKVAIVVKGYTTLCRTEISESVQFVDERE